MISALIVEDDKNAYLFLADCIRDVIPGCRIFHSESGEGAIDIIGYANIDVMFVDRGLAGKIDGLELVKIIRSDILYLTLPIVFVTANNKGRNEILEKYKYFEYITKPYSKEEFMLRISDFLLSVKKRKNNYIIKNLDEEKRSITVNGQIKIINLKDILFAEVYNKQITLYTTTQVYTKIIMPITKFIEVIRDPLFVQCQKSYAVNIRKIKNIMLTPTDAMEIEFEESDKKCRVGLTYLDDIREVIDNSK